MVPMVNERKIKQESNSAIVLNITVSVNAHIMLPFITQTTYYLFLL